MECLDIESVDNGAYNSPAPYIHGDVVAFMCDYGFELTAGDYQRTCDNGFWTGTSPTCTGKDCLQSICIKKLMVYAYTI